MCKQNISSYPQLWQMMSFQVAVVLWVSAVHYQTISQDQQLILVTTWGCPTWVLHPQPFVDIFWAWCTCHVSCWWSHVAHRPSKNVKVVSSPSLGFVFNHQSLLQYACLIFRPLVSSDDGFDTTHIHTKMVDRIRQSLAMCKLNTATYPQNLSTVADDVILSGSGSVVFTIRLSAKKARTSTSNNLRLPNMGTSPSAFRWHLLPAQRGSASHQSKTGHTQGVGQGQQQVAYIAFEKLWPSSRSGSWSHWWNPWLQPEIASGGNKMGTCLWGQMALPVFYFDF